MNAKKILFAFIAMMSICNVFAQLVEQAGIAYRYNGQKTRTPISGVYIKVATSPNGVVSQEHNGQFVLNLKGINMGDPMGYATVSKQGMMVFNKEEVDRWSVQKKPLVLIVCDANEFQKQKEQWIAIGRNQAEKKYKQKIANLEAQKAESLLTLDQYYAKLDSIEKEKGNALAHMDEYADLFARIDESEIDTVSQKAMDLFKQGYIDEAIAMFKKNDPIAKIAKSVRIKEQAEEMRRMADSADSLAQKDIEKNIQSAKAYIAALKLKNDWDEVGRLLKELADTLGTLETIWDYAHFALSQNQYTEAETYFNLCKNRIISLPQPRTQVNELNLAMCYTVLSYLYNFTNQFNKSEQFGKLALKICKRLAELNPLTFEPILAVCYGALAYTYSATNQFNKSEQMYKLALKKIEYSAKIAPQPLVLYYVGLARLYYQTNKFNECERINKLALEINERLAESNPQAYEMNLVVSYESIANLYLELHYFSECEQMCKSALKIYKRWAETNPQKYEPLLVTFYNTLACLYYDTHRFNECEQMHKTALEIRKRLAETYPHVYKSDLAASYDGLALLYRDTQRFDESEQMHKLALEIWKCLAESNPQAYKSNLAASYNSLALLYRDTQRFGESEQMHKLALEIWKRLAESNPQAYEPNLAVSCGNLAILYNDIQRFDESKQMHKLALEIWKRLAKSNPQAYEPDLATSYYNFGNLYYRAQQFAESELMYVSALSIYEHLTKANPQLYNNQCGMCIFTMSELKIRQEKYAEAIILLNKILDFYRKEAENGISLDYYTTIIDWLNNLYVRNGKFSYAYQLIKQNMRTLKAIYKIDHEKYSKITNRIFVNHSLCLIFERQYSEAEKCSKEALRVDSTQHMAYTNLAAAYLFQGKYNAAEKVYRQYKAELKKTFLNDFEEFAKAGVIPVERMADVEKIRKMLND